MKQETAQKVLIATLLSETGDQTMRSFEELKGLAEAVEAEVVGEIIQRRDTPDSKTYFGKGKVEEMKSIAEHLEAELLVVDDELSGSHLANLQEALDLPVLDRTGLILDIFAQRCRSALSRDQVELAQLEYRKTRLRGVGIYLSRQGGGIGTRGPGETKLETDRRALDLRISELKKNIQEAKSVLDNQRKRRLSQFTPRVALAGYTNSGKSSLANYLMRYSDSRGANIEQKDMLFTTLETYVRRIELEEGRAFYLSDTVGFIDRLPHGLIEAFKATLEEVLYADFILLLADGSTVDSYDQLELTRSVLTELGAQSIPSLTLLTKSDLGKVVEMPGAISISVKTGEGMDEFLDVLKRELFKEYSEKDFFFPYGSESAQSSLISEASLIRQKYTDAGVISRFFVHRSISDKYLEYSIENGQHI